MCIRDRADSARIIHQLGSGLVQYAMSAGLSVVVDVFVYCVLVKWLLLGLPLAPRLFFAAVIARTLSSVVNYTCNRRLPYVQNKKIGPTVAKYYCLWLAQLMLSFVCVWAACTGLHMLSLIHICMVQGPSHTNLIFDTVVPHNFPLSDDALRKRIQSLVETHDAGETKYYAVVTIDHSYAAIPGACKTDGKE